MKRLALTITAALLCVALLIPHVFAAESTDVQLDEQAVARPGDMTLGTSPVATDDANGNVLVKLYLYYKGSSMIDGRNLSFFEISPKVDKPEDFPFQITWTSYVLGMGDQHQDEYDYSKPNPDNIAGGLRKYFPFQFKTKKDVINGYYPITFTVKYLHTGQRVAVTQIVEDELTIYVNITHGKDPATPTPEPSYTPAPDPTPKPEAKVILGSFEMDPDDVVGGDTFDLKLTLENTHKNQAVRNMRCMLEDPEGMVLPESGSSTFYIESIPASGTASVTIRMQALPEAGIKPVKMTLDLQYDDRITSGVTAKETFTLPIHQVIRLEYDDPYLPTQVYVDEPFDVSFNFRNTGKAAMYNTLVTLESDTMRADASFYAGTVEGGTQKTYEPYVTVSSDRLQYAEPANGGEDTPGLDMGDGIPGIDNNEGAPTMDMPAGIQPRDGDMPEGGDDSDPSIPDEDGAVGAIHVGDYASAVMVMPMPSASGSGDGMMYGEDYSGNQMVCRGNIVITYEDNLGQQFRKEIPISTSITSYDQAYGPDMNMPMYDPVTGYPIDPVTGELIDPVTGEPLQRGLAPWVIVLLVAGGVAVVVAAIIIVRVVMKRKKRKLEMEMENEVD